VSCAWTAWEAGARIDDRADGQRQHGAGAFNLRSNPTGHTPDTTIFTATHEIGLGRAPSLLRYASRPNGGSFPHHHAEVQLPPCAV